MTSDSDSLICMDEIGVEWVLNQPLAEIMNGGCVCELQWKSLQ